MKILIEPNDVLMFRESKPYNAGESHLARSVYPLPQTIAGTLRTAILIKNDFSKKACNLAGVEKVNGKFIPKEPEFKVLGHFLFKEKEDKNRKITEYFPTPFDIVRAKGLRDYFFVKPLFLEHWNRFIFKGKSIHFEGVGGFIDYDDLISYLKGELSEDELEDSVRHDLIINESRVGIKLGNARTTEEGFFYKAEFLRLSGISVWIGENGKKLKEFLGDGGLMSLGGERRFVRFKVEDDENPVSKLEKAWDEIKEEINREKREKRFKLYVATPLLIKDSKGCFSWDISHCIIDSKNEDQKHGIKNIKIRRIYPLIGKPITFSGWDYAENKPKPNRYAIPAGSVYFVEFEGEIDYDKPYLKIGELTKLGYGLCFMGVWKDE